MIRVVTLQTHLAQGLNSAGIRNIPSAYNKQEQKSFTPFGCSNRWVTQTQDGRGHSFTITLHTIQGYINIGNVVSDKN